MASRRLSSRRALLHEPPPWGSGPLALYHGTTDTSAIDIITHGVNLRRGRPDTDFGRGFYTTTSLTAAQTWARDTAAAYRYRKFRFLPAVLRFDVDREQLAAAAALCFVRGDSGADDYWSLVWHCRRTGGDHRRPAGGGWYDVVYGPVAANYRAKTVIAGVDQVSFHTAWAGRLLDASSPQVMP